MKNKIFELSGKMLTAKQAARLVKEICKRLDISQNKLAEDTQISVSTFCRWQREETNPDIGTVTRLRLYFMAANNAN